MNKENDAPLLPVQSERMISHDRSRQKRIWCSIIAVILGILTAIAVISVFRAVKNAVEKPLYKPTFPKEYEANLLLHMPYSNVTEPIYAHVKESSGVQRLSYYGGMDTYIFNTSGPSYQIVPVIHQLECFAFGPTALQHVFPNLTAFRAQSGVSTIRDVSCHSWELQVTGSTPTSEGLIGVYTFYADSKTNAPVRFHFTGHNTLLGGSHVDEYYMDYMYIRDGPVDDSIFQQFPQQMKCNAGRNLNRNPLQDIHMLFPEGQSTRHQVYDDFKTEFQKTKSNNSDEIQRATIFHHNLRYINSINRMGLSYHLGLNHLADLYPHERQALFGQHNLVRRPKDNGAPCVHDLSTSDELPDKIDWREHGAVTPVKDQGVCGSCWSFGTTGAIEGAYFRKKGKLVSFSEQNLIDCSWSEGNLACNGGLDYQAYNWILRHGGLQATSTYGPYMNTDAFCHYNPARAATMMTGYCNVTQGTAGLNHALATIGPLSVSIDATQPSFYFYAGGFYTDSKCKSGIDDLDHSVLAVGYLTHGDEKYTIVKNSWSTHWGANGYVFIAQRDNICGVATAPTYPQVI